MEDYVLTEEEETQVREGQAAATLLDDPIFLLAIERVRQQCAEGIHTSEPSKAAEREHLYNLSRGLSAVTAELTNLASVSATILEAAERSTQLADTVQAEEPDDRDY